MYLFPLPHGVTVPNHLTIIWIYDGHHYCFFHLQLRFMPVEKKWGISTNWKGYSRYTKWREKPKSCLEDWWNAGNPHAGIPMQGGSWNARNGNSRNLRTKISRSSSGKKNDPKDLRIAPFGQARDQLKTDTYPRGWCFRWISRSRSAVTCV